MNNVPSKLMLTIGLAVGVGLCLAPYVTSAWYPKIEATRWFMAQGLGAMLVGRSVAQFGSLKKNIALKSSGIVILICGFALCAVYLFKHVIAG